MLNKFDNSKSSQHDLAPEPIPMSVASSTTAASDTSSQGSPAAVIGPKIRFKGELIGEEDLLVQGQIDGTIDLKGNTLTIGKHGTVNANVLAKTITIEGTVEGDIYGQERIEILSSSNVKGNLVADRVTLEDGAKFRGSIDMDIEDRKDEFENFGKASGKMQPPALTGASDKKPNSNDK